MEQEADLSTSSSEHLAPVTSGSVVNTSAQKKKSAKSRLAQPFKSLVGRSASLRSKPEEEASGETGTSGADTLPRAATKPKKMDKKSKKVMQSGDESKSKEAISAGEDLTTEEGKRNRKKKSSIVRRLSNKIRTSKPEQESGATSEMSAADQTSEDAHSMTSSSTYGAKTPEHPSAPPPSTGGKESEEEWVSSKEANSEPEKTEPEPPPSPSPVGTPVPKPRETPPPPPQATPEPLPATPEPVQPVLAAVRSEETVAMALEHPSENGAGNPLTSTDPPIFPISDLAQNGERREHLYKILVIGELGTGKTSIIKRYVHQFFSQHYRATIGVDFALKVLTWDQNTIIRLQLWDIAGQERFGNMTRVYYKEAVGAFIVFDVTRTATFEAVLKWKADLDSKVQLPDGSSIPCVLLANKCDQQKEGIANAPAKMDEYCKENGFSGWYETSAKENINIDDAARFLVSKILQNDKVANVTSNKEDGFSLDKPEGEQNQKSCPC